MPFRYTGSGVSSGCDWSVKTTTETESLMIARQHIAEAHGMPDLKSELMRAIRQAIHRSD